MLRSTLALSLGLVACASAPPPDAPPASVPASAAARPATEVKIFALSDFHGWLLPRTTRSNPRFYGGIANIAASIRHRDGGTPETALILDNGDMWTGPVESTFLKGEPVVEAYNALGVAAANVANHEFDFGVEILTTRAAEANFPFLGANVVDRTTGKAPPYLVPYTVVERSGVKVGVVGLSFVGTPETTLAKNVAGLGFEPYVPTLRRVVPEVKAAGAEVVVVLLHDIPTAVHAVVRELKGSLPIDLMVAGQDHRQSLEIIEGVPVLNPGPFGASYGKFVVRYDHAAGKVLGVEPEIVNVTGSVAEPPYPPDPALAAVAASARERTASMSDAKLGELARPMPVGNFASSPMGQLIVDAWLSSLADEADIAMLNHGAIRQPLPAGPVTLGNITSVMPFENNIYLLELTGAHLKSQLAIDHPVVSGLTWTYREGKEGRTVVSAFDASGQPLDDAKNYRVAVLDFMYTGGDGYTFSALDDSPVDTGLSWRDPVIRKLRAAALRNQPLDPHRGPRAKRIR